MEKIKEAIQELESEISMLYERIEKLDSTIFKLKEADNNLEGITKNITIPNKVKNNNRKHKCVKCNIQIWDKWFKGKQYCNNCYNLISDESVTNQSQVSYELDTNSNLKAVHKGIPGKKGRPKGSLTYTDEEIQFVKDNIQGMKMPILINSFNKKFGTDFPIESRALYNLISRIKGNKEKSEDKNNEPSINEICPLCSSKNIIKRGLRYNKNKNIQKYQCKSCGKKFSNEGIGHRMRNSREDIEKALELHKSGKSDSEIATELGVSRQSIFKWLKKFTKKELNKPSLIEQIKGLPTKKKGNSEVTDYIRENKDIDTLKLRNLIGDKFGIWLSQEQIKFRMREKKYGNNSNTPNTPMSNEEINRTLDKIEPNSEVEIDDEYDPSELEIDDEDLE